MKSRMLKFFAILLFVLIVFVVFYVLRNLNYDGLIATFSPVLKLKHTAA